MRPVRVADVLNLVLLNLGASLEQFVKMFYCWSELIEVKGAHQERQFFLFVSTDS